MIDPFSLTPPPAKVHNQSIPYSQSQTKMPDKLNIVQNQPISKSAIEPSRSTPASTHQKTFSIMKKQKEDSTMIQSNG